MHRAWELKTKHTLQLTLPRGSAQEVVTADNIRDPIGRVIHHDGEVIGPCTISPAQDEVANLLGDILRNSPRSPILKLLRSFFHL
jgi:hypothetical protein